MGSVTVPRLMTAEEFEQLDDVLGFRDELIEGERVLSPTPFFAHTVLVKHLDILLTAQLPQMNTEPSLIVREAGWKFHIPRSGADSVPVPDLMVIRVQDAQRAMESMRWFEGVPLLAVEVVSPSERKSRRLQKIGLYLEMGAPHVVEVDYTRRSLRVHTPDSETPTVYQAGDEMTRPFRVDLQEFFSILNTTPQA